MREPACDLNASHARVINGTRYLFGRVMQGGRCVAVRCWRVNQSRWPVPVHEWLRVPSPQTVQTAQVLRGRLSLLWTLSGTREQERWDTLRNSCTEACRELREAGEEPLLTLIYLENELDGATEIDLEIRNYLSHGARGKHLRALTRALGGLPGGPDVSVEGLYVDPVYTDRSRARRRERR